MRVNEAGSLNPEGTDPGRARRGGGSSFRVAGLPLQFPPFQARLFGATEPQTKSNAPLTAAN